MGVPGLDDVLAGGLPRGRLYLVEGDPGTGKTTLWFTVAARAGRQRSPIRPFSSAMPLGRSLSVRALRLAMLATAFGDQLDGGRSALALHDLELAVLVAVVRDEEVLDLLQPACR
jgi:predicted ATP-dependent serine protease